MLGDVLHRGALDPHRRVVPADAAARAVARRVVGVAAVDREVDPADVGDPVVDHDRLLVVAMGGARAASRSRTGSPCAASASGAPPRRRRASGRKTAIGAPFQSRTRTSIRSASRASSVRTTSGSSSLLSCSSGERNQPVRWTCDVASPMSRAIRGRASDPSTRTSTLLPSRGGKVPCAQRVPRRVERVLPARLPQPQPVPAADRPVDAPPDDVAELDGELVEKAGRAKPSCGRGLGPPPGRRPLATGETVGHVLPT